MLSKCWMMGWITIKQETREAKCFVQLFRILKPRPFFEPLGTKSSTLTSVK
ncbi:hypothetical protein RchiOBHm_Chr3g0483291 [Rosa chinensis]|uniref:Uncharacterized protein n=1 Tax=Rosa chinensis TaxID=74649 RepID=A0A2P6REH2_ROSCH|nr:hypothetical protein RchiOBHm_Chr3g0483291 [Rosa chinensis]